VVQAAVVAVADRHDEVRADERHDLAGLDQLGGRGGLVVLDVGHGLEHHEQRVLVALQLGPLLRRDGVLDGQLVQAVGLGDGRDLVVGGLVQPDPHEPLAALADLVDGLVVAESPVEAHAVDVDGAVDDVGRQRHAELGQQVLAAGAAQRRADRGQGVLGQRGHRALLQGLTSAHAR
jgi:hypothetical protein